MHPERKLGKNNGMYHSPPPTLPNAPAAQASDAEGTVRVLRALLAPDGHAYFVVAHPRTRFGVDALAPLLEQSPDLDFTCEEVSDPRLLAGLEEAEYLAWLQVHVWWAERAANVGGVTCSGGGFNPGLLVCG